MGNSDSHHIQTLQDNLTHLESSSDRESLLEFACKITGQILCRDWDRKLSFLAKHGVYKPDQLMNVLQERFPESNVQVLSEALNGFFRICKEELKLEFWFIAIMMGCYSLIIGDEAVGCLAKEDLAVNDMKSVILFFLDNVWFKAETPVVVNILKKADGGGIDRLSKFLLSEESNWRTMMIGPSSEEPSALLSRSDIFCLWKSMPVDCRDKWSLLYSSRINGKSWFQFSSCILYRGSTIIIIKSRAGNVFGAFSNTTLELGPNYCGSGENFLFRLVPKIQIFHATGYNSNFQYMNQGTKTLPNGLGFGGQFGYFGLWIDSDFGKGSCKGTPVCTTYGNDILSSGGDGEDGGKEEDFMVDMIEVWCVKEAEMDDRLMEKKSAMLANPEVMALLDMTNKKSYHVYDAEEDPEREAKSNKDPNRHQYVSYD